MKKTIEDYLPGEISKSGHIDFILLFGMPAVISTISSFDMGLHLARNQSMHYLFSLLPLILPLEGASIGYIYGAGYSDPKNNYEFSLKNKLDGINTGLKYLAVCTAIQATSLLAGYGLGKWL